jgi:hypothetical protein
MQPAATGDTAFSELNQSGGSVIRVDPYDEKCKSLVATVAMEPA